MRVAAVLALLAVGACASTAGRSASEEPSNGRPVALLPARLEVRNASMLDVNVFAVRGGAVVRLGTVTAKTEATFDLPEVLRGSTADLRFLVDPIGSTEAFLSDPVRGRAATVVLRVAPVLAQSTVSGR